MFVGVFFFFSLWERIRGKQDNAKQVPKNLLQSSRRAFRHVAAQFTLLCRLELTAKLELAKLELEILIATARPTPSGRPSRTMKGKRVPPIVR